MALIAYDDPTTIRTSYSDRDAIFRDDYFGIMLDTYGDQNWGYEIFVNPYGIQGDLRMISSGDEDISFDLVWESMGKITDSGYQVEIAIPFASLRFPDKPVQTWRINFWRDHQREVRSRFSWAAQDRDNDCFICQWGYLTGIQNIVPGKNIEIIPNLIATQSGSRSRWDNPDSEFLNDDPNAEVSLNARYGISSNSSIEFTINPDFSQVESDQQQVDVNNPFGLSYPERRPFFQEGSELFNGWIRSIYTRSINNPEAALKYTGQFGRLGIAYMFARDEVSPVLVPLQQQARLGQVEKSYINIMRGKQTFGEDSFIGVTFTDRRYDDFGIDDMHTGGSGTTFGIDANLRLNQNWRIEMQTMASYTREIRDAHLPVDTTIEILIDSMPIPDTTYDTSIYIPSIISSPHQTHFDNGQFTVDLDGESYWGEAQYISLERGGRIWNFDMDYWAISPTFRTDNGFNTRNDYRTLNVWTGLYFRPNKKWLLAWEPSINFGRSWNYNGKLDITDYGTSAFDEWARIEIFAVTRFQTELGIEYINSQEQFFGRNFPGISRLSFFLNGRFTELIGGGFNYTEGKSVWRDRSDPDLGYARDFELFSTIKPTERIVISPSFYSSRMDRRTSYFEDDNHTGEAKEIFDASVFFTRLNIQFDRNWYLRLIFQYANETVYGEQEKYFDVEPLLTYKINPFTKFYIGMSMNYNYVLPNDEVNSIKDPVYSLSGRQFFAKFQYLFRM